MAEFESGIEEEKLRKWRNDLEAFYVSVRDIKKHKELYNPFVPDVDRGECGLQIAISGRLTLVVQTCLSTYGGTSYKPKAA